MSYGIPGVPMLPPGGPSVGVPLELPKDVVRVGEQALWSTQLIAAATPQGNQTYRLFSTALGATGQGYTPMTLAETNIKEGGRIPAGLAYDTYGVACVVKGTAVAPAAVGNVIQAYNHSVLSWDFLATQIDIAPTALIGAGGGVFGVSSDAASAATAGPYLNNGSGGLWVYRRHPVALPANTTFNILLKYGATAGNSQATDYAMQVVLVGSYRQAVEIG